MMEQFFYNIWYKKGFSVFSLLLFPLTAFYYICWKIKDIFYEKFNMGFTLDCPVISVGNVTLGGTGKTPFILYLLTFLKGKRVVVLTRGYKGKIEGIVEDKDGFSDEARLIKKRFPDVVVLAGKDRYKNYLKYRSNNEKPDLVILDDGFQHRRIKRNFDIVMFDGTLLYGNSLLFPSGPLREPLQIVNRKANLIVIKDGSENSISLLKKKFPAKKIVNFCADTFKLFTLSGEEIEEKDLQNRKITAFCGIGNPDSFKTSLKKLGIIPNIFTTYGDHIIYTPSILEEVVKSNADIYITTEKDAVKLTKLWYNSKKLVILLPEYKLNENITELLNI